MAAPTAKRFFRSLDPNIETDWPDDDVFGPALASDWFDRLDRERQEPFLSALRDVFAVTHPRTGVDTLREALRARGGALPPPPRPADDGVDFSAKAMLDHPEAWEETLFVVGADCLPEARWGRFRIEPEGAGLSSDPTDGQLRELAAAIQSTWSRSAGRYGFGRVVEFKYRLCGAREYYVGEVSGLPTRQRLLHLGTFDTRVVTPAFGISIEYDRMGGMLRVGTSVPKVQIASIAANWSRCIKGVGPVPVAAGAPPLVLERFVDPRFSPTPDPGGSIMSVRRSRIEIELIGSQRARVYKSYTGDALDDLRTDERSGSVRRGGYEVVEVWLETLILPGDRPPKKAIVKLRPTGWSLTPPGLSPLIREMVREQLIGWEVLDAVAA